MLFYPPLLEIWIMIILFLLASGSFSRSDVLSKACMLWSVPKWVIGPCLLISFILSLSCGWNHSWYYWSLILCSEDMSMIFFLVPEMHSSFAFWLAKWPELGQKAMSDTQTQAWNYRITEQLPRSCEWLSKGQKYEQHYLWLSEWFDIHSLSSFVRRLVLSNLCQAKDYLKNDLRQAQYTVKKKKKGQFRCIPGDKNPAPDVEVVLLSCCCQICLPLDKEFSFLHISFVTFSQGSSFFFF